MNKEFWIVLTIVCTLGGGEAILYPQASETREVMSLDGLWNFAYSERSGDPLEGRRQQWYKKDLTSLNDVKTIQMPVPSSYNDITTDPRLRDYVGVVWYDRKFFVSKSWTNKNVWLRFSSVVYMAEVWINGELVMMHQIGHLPFEAEISRLLKFGGENRVTVACDNTLLSTTVPQGNVVQLDTDYGNLTEQTYTFDFFNYAGIHRPVTLYTSPKDFIEDITIRTEVIDNTGIIHYNVSTKSSSNNHVGVKIFDKSTKFVASQLSQNGTIVLKNASLWWPYLMDPNPGYLYSLQVELLDQSGELVDIYRVAVGVRSLKWTNSILLINGKPVYLHGFGRHEDSDIRGKGLDLATVMRDYNLIQWVGGNAYRTSHYPYADEIMDVADRLGIMIIDECPGVNIDLFTKELQDNHKQSITELIARDKNRPSVIAWSIANEPRSNKPQAADYFRGIANHTKTLDKTRPITAAINMDPIQDHLAQYLDIVSFNRYNSWYQNGGRLDMIVKNVVSEAKNWRKVHNKPVLISEYGADTIEGLHILPTYIWSEEYQVTLMSRHFKAFDELRKEGWFIGEFIWNFADFKTAQTITRVGGNKKGIFTRNRQPKNAAHHLRTRYFLISKELHNSSIPSDLYQYTHPLEAKDEL